MRVQRTIVVDREPERVFALVSDPNRYPEFFVGITRWEPASRKRRGPGARFRVRMRVGSIEAGGEVKVTAWKPGRLIAWAAERGIPQRGAWRLRPVRAGTEIRLEVEFDLSGGPLGRLVERAVGRIVGRNLSATLLAVRRILEQEGSVAAVEARA
ncbi:MAG TPA: SRPBCC family protein [Actinomycetota bacterium]|nr:SRPBCC family protein [Actinomycetota bacterium]